MSTRSLTVFKDEEGQEIAVMYRQLDGYPKGHGKDLTEMLSGIKMVNGLSIDNPGKVANGMGCLAAQIVAHFKEGPGGIYLLPAGSRDCGEDYTYLITGNTDEPEIEIRDRRKLLYKGAASNYALLLATNQASN